jgi:hypothetical protein
MGKIKWLMNLTSENANRPEALENIPLSSIIKLSYIKKEQHTKMQSI